MKRINYKRQYEKAIAMLEQVSHTRYQLASNLSGYFCPVCREGHPLHSDDCKLADILIGESKKLRMGL